MASLRQMVDFPTPEGPETKIRRPGSGRCGRLFSDTRDSRQDDCVGSGLYRQKEISARCTGRVLFFLRITALRVGGLVFLHNLANQHRADAGEHALHDGVFHVTGQCGGSAVGGDFDGFEEFDGRREVFDLCLFDFCLGHHRLDLGVEIGIGGFYLVFGDAIAGEVELCFILVDLGGECDGFVGFKHFGFTDFVGDFGDGPDGRGGVDGGDQGGDILVVREGGFRGVTRSEDCHDGLARSGRGRRACRRG